MKNFSALTRITVGLVSSMLGILMAARFVGLLPDEEAFLIDSRSRVASGMRCLTCAARQSLGTTSKPEPGSSITPADFASP